MYVCTIFELVKLLQYLNWLNLADFLNSLSFPETLDVVCNNSKYPNTMHVRILNVAVLAALLLLCTDTCGPVDKVRLQ
jgi:hypothetical protein